MRLLLPLLLLPSSSSLPPAWSAPLTTLLSDSSLPLLPAVEECHSSPGLYCDKVAALSLIRETEAARRAGRGRGEGSGRADSYEAFFNAQAADSTAAMPGPDWPDGTEEWLATCAAASPSSDWAPVSSCAPAPPGTPVPAYAYNDYQSRLSASSSPGAPPPSVYVLQAPAAPPPPSQSCPDDMHALLVSPPSAAADVSLSYHAPSAVLRHSSYTSSPAPTLLASLPPPSSLSLAPGSSLLLPGGSFSALSAPSPVPLLRFCLLDATNLHSVTAALRVRVLLDASDAAAAAKLARLDEGAADLAMAREVHPLALAEYGTYPRPPPPAPEAEAAADDSAAAAGAAEGGKKKKKRDRRSKQSFSDWQATKAWDHRVLALTLPTLPKPTVASAGRREATVRWTSAFQVPEGSASQLNFVVAYSGVAADGEARHDGRELFVNLKGRVLTKGGAGAPRREYTGVVEGLHPGTRYVFTVALQYGAMDSGDDTPPGSETSPDGSPSSSDVSTSPFSPSSPPASTGRDGPPSAAGGTPRPVPPRDWDEIAGAAGNGGSAPAYRPAHGSEATVALLRFPAPADDGGSPVLGYAVLRSHVDRGGHAEGDWVMVGRGVEVVKAAGAVHGQPGAGDDVVVAVHHLLPGAGYRFRVAAVNALGRGEWSGATEVARTARVGGSVMLQEGVDDGGGDRHGHVPDAGHVLHGLGSDGHPHAGDASGTHHLCIVDDVAQEVTVGGAGGGKVEAWAGWWSPRGFRASGEMQDVEWREGEGLQVENAGEVAHRVGVVERGAGGAPLVRLALAVQRAGGVAAVVVDRGGLCGTFDQYCVLGADKGRGELWGEVDLAKPWLDLRVPVVLVRGDDNSDAATRR
ncbi:hypothetical protein TeGR_g1306 [Tetraparma gracilis]|uniref:Fibronectin type-III domain-containing protein n=1 Tax=Tetraparma gracilis TaxID=2962635 RepID=A0ABQ6N284_9STRA|nr:hypothetical protein TeGR_g1306 [Tetraparma gracilis]